MRAPRAYVPNGIALLLQGPDDAFDHAILLRAMRRDELLLQSVTPRQSGVTATGEHQAVIRAQQELRRHSAQRTIARNQRLLQR